MQDGITLISLIITIVIMLIIAGVAISIAVDANGLFARTKYAVDKYNKSNIREYLEQTLLALQLDKSSGDGNSKKLGEELYTRDLNHSHNWHIVKVNDKTYGTGWNYVEKGKELEGYGTAGNSFLINYETGDIIELEEGKYTSLSAGDMLAVKDSLIINVDSSVIDKEAKTIKEVEEVLGSGVTLHGFDENKFTEDSGLTSESFNFDGVDDWIEVDYSNNEEKNKLIENGFTFEFYGDTSEVKAIENGTEVENPNDNGGGFGWWDGDENHFAKLHFNMLRKDRQLIIKWTGATGSKTYPEIKIDEDNVWEVVGLGDGNGWVARAFPKLNKADDFYVTITFNPKSSKQLNNETVFEIKLYINGNYIGNGWYYKGYWDNLSNKIENLNKICIARTSMNANNYWLYPKMKIYALRLYSRALTEEEVTKNYQKSIEYHSVLENE